MTSLNTLKSAVGLALLLALSGCAESFGPLDSPYDAKNPTRAVVRVSYDGNGATGGTVPVDPTSYGPGDRVALLGNTGALTKAPAVFDGWNTRADGKGLSLVPGSNVILGTTGITFFAKWSTGSQTVAITGFSLSENALTLALGTPKTLVPSFQPADTTQTALTWSSLDTSIASVDQSGVITPVKLGTTTVLAISGPLGKAVPCQVTVVQAAVAATAVSLDQNSVNLVAGGASTPLRATFTPPDTTDTTLTWTTSNSAVATVTDGVVTPGTIAGATIIKATSSNGKTAECIVTVGLASVAVTGVNLSATTLNLAVGTGGTLAAQVLPEGATNKNVSWLSTDESVVTVSSSGAVTPLKEGTATIIVTTSDGGKNARCTVTVVPANAAVAVTGVSLSTSSMTLVTGVTGTLTAAIAPTTATNTKVAWKSSDPAVASISSSGVVTPLKVGQTTITVTTDDGAKTATCLVTVGSVTIAVSSLTLSAPTLSLTAGTAVPLSVTVSPANATDQWVDWASSDKTIADINSGLVTAYTPGTCDITATTRDKTISVSCRVTVNPPPSGTASLTFQLGAFGYLSFSPATVDVVRGHSVTLAPASGAVAAGGTGWQWLVDGAAGGTGDSFVFDAAGRSPGTYQVFVSVLYQSVLYSGTLQVTVTHP